MLQSTKMERSLERAIRSSAWAISVIRTRLGGRRRLAGATADVHLRPAGESSTGDPQRFGHAAGRFQPRASRGTDPRRRSSPTIAAGQCCRRVLQGGKTVPVRRPAANLLRHGCAKVAERIRASMGVTAGEAGPRQRAATAMPWLGLLLWALACAGLFVSLIMRTDDPDRDRRVAVRVRARRQSRPPPTRCAR